MPVKMTTAAVRNIALGVYRVGGIQTIAHCTGPDLSSRDARSRAHPISQQAYKSANTQYPRIVRSHLTQRLGMCVGIGLAVVGAPSSTLADATGDMALCAHAERLQGGIPLTAPSPAGLRLRVERICRLVPANGDASCSAQLNATLARARGQCGAGTTASVLESEAEIDRSIAWIVLEGLRGDERERMAAALAAVSRSTSPAERALSVLELWWVSRNPVLAGQPAAALSTAFWQSLAPEGSASIHLQRVLTLLREGATLDEASTRVFGAPYPDAVEKWRLKLQQRMTPLLGIWAALACLGLLLAVLAWRRRAKPVEPPAQPEVSLEFLRANKVSGTQHYVRYEGQNHPLH